ncbi:MAG TPA: DUF6569 family protein, partial [Alphaproteobacteria bacterium]|nr:DUF6569 family protein [Alphaproteobacteria bacterium]
NKFMVQPSVRQKVMADANQQKVWDEVHTTQSAMAEVVASAPATSASGGIGSGGGSGRGAGGGGGDASAMRLRGMSSYAGVREDKDVQKQVDSIAEPMQKSYESVIKQLREQNAVGVVVAVKGHIIWADIFASNALLNKYWPKLLQSYAVEALTMPGKSEEVSSKEADSFLHNWEAQHEVVDSEPGLYRQRELTGNRFKAFQLTSLLPKLSYDVHLSKMAE